MDRKHQDILGVRVSSTQKGGVISLVASGHKKLLIFTPNPEIILASKNNPELKAIINSADLAICDGFGLVLASLVLHGRSLPRIRGRELFMDLLSLASKEKLKVFLLGSTPDVIRKCERAIAKEYPGIVLRAESGPRLDGMAKPVSEQDTKLERNVLVSINKFNPDLLFVAFGAPKQEIWLGSKFLGLKVKTAMAVGGSLDYFAGTKPLPPGLFSALGFEWLWRLMHEKGHAKRVVNALLVFPSYVLRSKLGL